MSAEQRNSDDAFLALFQELSENAIQTLDGALSQVVHATRGFSENASGDPTSSEIVAAVQAGVASKLVPVLMAMRSSNISRARIENLRALWSMLIAYIQSNDPSLSEKMIARCKEMMVSEADKNHFYPIVLKRAAPTANQDEIPDVNNISILI